MNLLLYLCANDHSRRILHCIILLVINGLIFQNISTLAEVVYHSIEVVYRLIGYFKEETLKLHITVPVILWWTPFTGTLGDLRRCGPDICYFTEDRKYLGNPQTKAIMFYGSGLNITDLPLPRAGISWALLHEESPRNSPFLLNGKLLSSFNFSATFSQHSHFPLTTLYLKNIDSIIGTKHYVSLSEKNRLLEETDIAPVLYIQSDCSTPCDRDSYVAELMKHIRVDSYGACLNNRQLPHALTDAMEVLHSDEFYHFVARYKFTIAIENGICNDYITEKFWRPLIVGSVPVYYGSPTIKDWLPYNDSAILISDFKSAVMLADYLHTLNSNDVLYEKFMKHKTHQLVTNTVLKETLKNRLWFLDYYDGPNFVETYECFLCNQLYKESAAKKVQQTHYQCEDPTSILTNNKNSSNWWGGVWEYGKCVGEYVYFSIEQQAESIIQEDVKRFCTSNVRVT